MITKNPPSVTASDKIAVTVWRQGYFTVNEEIEIPTEDTAVDLILQLLPWWLRIETIKAEVVVPSVYQWGTYGPYQFIVNVGKEVNSCSENWQYNNGRLIYNCNQDLTSGDVILKAYINIDKSTGIIQKAELSSLIDWGQSTDTVIIKLNSLPMWTFESADSLELVSESDSTGYSVDTASHEGQKLEPDPDSGFSRTVVYSFWGYGGHSGHGYKIKCQVLLRD